MCFTAGRGRLLTCRGRWSLRLAEAGALTDETGQTGAVSLVPGKVFRARDEAPVKRVMTDDALAYARHRALK